jgi:hypothetical protein
MTDTILIIITTSILTGLIGIVFWSIKSTISSSFDSVKLEVVKMITEQQNKIDSKLNEQQDKIDSKLKDMENSEEFQKAEFRDMFTRISTGLVNTGSEIMKLKVELSDYYVKKSEFDKFETENTTAHKELWQEIRDINGRLSKVEGSDNNRRKS